MQHMMLIYGVPHETKGPPVRETIFLSIPRIYTFLQLDTVMFHLIFRYTFSD